MDVETLREAFSCRPVRPMGQTEDHDWMIPRRSPEANEEKEPPSSHNVKVDPTSLRGRQERKRRLVQSPGGSNTDEPWSHIDQGVARMPAFAERMWTLGDTARWVTERTAQAVNGLSVDEEKLSRALPEIHEALASGEVAAFAHTVVDPVPRELPSETWAVYELVLEELNGLIRIFPLHSSSSDHDQDVLSVRVRRGDVLQRWPDPANPLKPVPPTTKAAENQCRRWLVAMMRENLDKPRTKHAVSQEALAKFKGLGMRGFNRAWDQAVGEAPAPKWRGPGRRT